MEMLGQLIQLYLVPFLAKMAVDYPVILGALSVMAVARAVFKPIMKVIEAYVLSTETLDDIPISLV